MSLIRRNTELTKLTIANGGTTSGAVDARNHAMFSLAMPAAFTGATISFLVSPDNVTYQALYDDTNTQVTVTVAAARTYDLPAALASAHWFKVVSAASEAADRTLYVTAKG